MQSTAWIRHREEVDGKGACWFVFACDRWIYGGIRVWIMMLFLDAFDGFVKLFFLLYLARKWGLLAEKRA